MLLLDNIPTDPNVQGVTKRTALDLAHVPQLHFPYSDKYTRKSATMVRLSFAGSRTDIGRLYKDGETVLHLAAFHVLDDIQGTLLSRKDAQVYHYVSSAFVR